MKKQNSIQFIRKMTKVGGGSLAVVIPAEIVRTLSLREKQKMTIELDGDQIIVQDWKKK